MKRGTKLSDDDYQIFWCQAIVLSYGGSNYKMFLPFRISTFKETLKKLMNKVKKENSEEEFKCTCTNNKSKIIKGRFNSITGEIKVE